MARRGSNGRIGGRMDFTLGLTQCADTVFGHEHQSVGQSTEATSTKLFEKSEPREAT